MLRYPLLLTALALLLSACGDSGDEEATPTAFVTDTATSQGTAAPDATIEPHTTVTDPTPPPEETAEEQTQQGSPIGIVVSVGDGLVNGRDAFNDDELYVGDVIETATSAQGDLRFTMLDGAVDCDARNGARLELRPQEAIEINWLDPAGATGCEIDAEESRSFSLLSLDQSISIDRGAFGVLNGELYVRKGIAYVFMPSSPGPPIAVCPQQKYDLADQSIERQPEYWQELPGVLRPVMESLPRGDLTFTPSGVALEQSAFLRELASGSQPLEVFVQANQPQQQEFIAGYFEMMLREWSPVVKRDAVILQPVQDFEKQDLLVERPGAVVVEQGQTITRNDRLQVLELPDLAVTLAPAQATAVSPPTSTPDLSTSLSASGLFLDQSGESWRLVLENDEVGNEAIQEFTKAAVLNGDFSRLHYEVFGELPPCQYLEQLVED